jgi:stress-induced-phosphoprotein 1
LALKEITKAMRCFNKALELDPNNVDATDGLKKCYMQDDPETRRKNAMQDPQIQQIMADPAMQIILQQMQENPGAINE